MLYGGKGNIEVVISAQDCRRAFSMVELQNLYLLQGHQRVQEGSQKNILF
jgi:hypothetical protein